MSPLVFTLRTTADFIIKGWHIDSYFGLSISMLLIIIIGMVFEGFQSFRFVHFMARAERYKRCCASPKQQRALALRTHLERSFLHMFQVVVGYMLMLCAMSYNVWIMISVVLGAGLGYFFLRPVVLHWLEQRKKNREKDQEKWSDLKVQFLNGVNVKAESKGCPSAKIDGERAETCA